MFYNARQRLLIWTVLSSTVSSRAVALSRLYTSASSSQAKIDISSTNTQRAKHIVTWHTTDPALGKDDLDTADPPSDGVTFDAYDGETLRTAALRRGIVSPHNGAANLINCRGLGTCGTCSVEIAAGSVDPPERNAVEKLRLNLPPHNFHNNKNRLRLACQIQIHQNITVVKRTGFWGQLDEVAVPSAPRKYFGEYEYLLDNKSPPEALNVEDNDKRPEQS